MLIVHIGGHKCGSSSIQHFMASNARKLSESGVVYTDMGRAKRAHHELAEQLMNGQPGQLPEIVALDRARPSGKVVLSSETFSLLKPRQIAELQRQIGDTRALIVLYVRDLVGWLPSQYNELTKKGGNLADFDQFYGRHGPSAGVKLASRAEAWGGVFGWENLRIRSLDSRSLTGGSLIEDFLSVLGLKLSDFGGAAARGLEPQNVSNGWKVLEVLRAQFAQLAAHEEHHEIRRNRPKIRRDIATALRNAVAEVMRDLGLGEERTQYLSARQWEESNAIFARELHKLNGRIIGPKLPLPELAAVKERPFLPSIERIPYDERREIARRLESALLGDERRPRTPWVLLEKAVPRIGRRLLGSTWEKSSVVQLDRAGVGADLRRSLIGTLIAVPPGE